jgi:hypothetical protein
MAVSRTCLFIIAAALICFGCSLKAIGPQSEGEQKLSAGIKNYEEGNYKESSKYIQEALTKGLSDKEDQIKAHKYLAFIHCVSNKKKRCSYEFKKVLELNPNFYLEPAEAGHPSWGPVFRSVKAKTSH